MEKRFFLIDNGPMMKSNWMKMCEDKRVTVLKQFKKSNLIYNIIKRIHLSGKINKIFPLPFKDMWCSSIKTIKWENNIEYYIIFEGTSIYPLSLKYLEKIKLKYNVHYILFMQDPWQHRCSKQARYYSARIKFDYIFTFDPADAQKYDFIFYDVPFSMFPISKTFDVKNDLFFVGTANNRLKQLLQIYESGMTHQANVLYIINKVKKLAQKHSKTIVYNKRIPYSKVIEIDNISNCILEVISANQSGASLRYYEAICYNKKLLTNNKNVVNLPFYNPDYIHVFEKPEDIDWEWVKKREPIDYHYDGRFSPKHLIDKIIKLEKERPQNV